MIYTTIGWIGAFLFVIAYWLLATDKLKVNKPTYHWLNVLGAILLVINAIAIADYPTVAVNLIWGIIAFLTCLKIKHKSFNFQKNQ